MPAFRYEAADTAGKTHTGVVSADNARAARSELREQGLLPLNVTEVTASAGGKRLSLRIGERMTATEHALFTRQLASLLDAALPLEQALAVLQQQAERTHLRDVIAAVRAEVTGGIALSQAMATYPRDFPGIFCGLVAAGEQTGRLAAVLSRLADYVERRNLLMQKVRLAFTYPAIVTVVAILIVLFLLTYVVPQIVSVFADNRQKLPLLTIAMLALSDFVRGYGWLLPGLCAAAALMWRRLLARPGTKLRWHGWLLNAPVYGRFERSLNTARFASTLAITTASGVPILAALQTSRETVSNLAMRAQIDEAAAGVREGASLAHALSGRKLFPPMLVHMIRAGETTGELHAMLDRAAAAQQQDLERRAMTIAGLLEPLLILAMGATVLLIVLAVLMPIIEINQLVH